MNILSFGLNQSENEHPVTRPGYKQTALGEIPEDWKLVRLGDVLEKITGGGTPSREIAEYWEGNIPWATVKDMKEGLYYLDSTLECITQKGVSESATNIVPAGTVIIATRVGLGRCFINKIDVTINQDLKALFPVKNSLDKNFLLLWFIQNSEIVQALGTGTTVKGIQLNQIKQLEILLPPLDEQQRIVAVLSEMDATIANTDKIIAQLHLLKQELVEELLTRGIGHSEFKEMELGEIPIKWEVVNFGDVAGIRTLKELPKSDYYLGLENFLQGEPVISSHSSNTKFSSTKNAFLRGDLLYGKLRPNLRKAAIAPFDGFCSTEILPVVANEKSSNKYLLYILHSEPFTNYVVNSAAGTKMPRTSWEIIAKYRFVLPPLDEQEQIANILAEVDKKIEKEMTYKVGLEELKQDLMRDLLSGRVRVPA